METATSLRRSPNASLKEKLQEHYQNRNFTPSPQRVSNSGLVTVACAIFVLFLQSVTILLPAVYSGQNGEDGDTTEARSGWFGETWWMALVLVVFLCLEVTWSWWRTYYDVPNWVTKDMKTAQFGQTMETPEGWRHCPTCQLDAPPRSHHCSLCGHCILKRDHHCFFTTSCIGFYNQRHFVMFCLYSIWGCALGIYLQVSYIHLFLPLPENYVTYIAPVQVFELFKGNLSFWIFLIFVHVYFNIACIAIAVTFLFWQLVLIFRGQTSHEIWKMIRKYDCGVYGNFTSVFGSPLSLLVLFFAPLMLPLQGDGINWNPKHNTGKGH